MGDLTVGVFVMILAGLAACWSGAWAAHRSRGAIRSVATGTLVAATLIFASKVQGRLIVASWVPLSNAIMLGNLTTLGAACLAGFVWGWDTLPRWRRMLFAAGMWAIGLVALLSALPHNPPPAGNEWIDGVCMQSNKASCSACAAATLLRYYGIRTNEAEMMRLCLTGATGTPSLGLYRGLKLKTAGTPYEVEVFHTDVASLLATDQLPAILLVKLEVGADVDPRYEQQWGWTPGLGHAVVYYGRLDSQRIEIGDPSVGLEPWTNEDLCVLWQGEGLRLRKR